MNEIQQINTAFIAQLDEDSDAYLLRELRTFEIDFNPCKFTFEGYKKIAKKEYLLTVEFLDSLNIPQGYQIYEIDFAKKRLTFKL